MRATSLIETEVPSSALHRRARSECRDARDRVGREQVHGYGTRRPLGGRVIGRHRRVAVYPDLAVLVASVLPATSVEA